MHAHAQTQQIKPQPDTEVAHGTCQGRACQGGAHGRARGSGVGSGHLGPPKYLYSFHHGCMSVRTAHEPADRRPAESTDSAHQ